MKSTGLLIGLAAVAGFAALSLSGKSSTTPALGGASKSIALSKVLDFSQFVTATPSPTPQQTSQLGVPPGYVRNADGSMSIDTHSALGQAIASGQSSGSGSGSGAGNVGGDIAAGFQAAQGVVNTVSNAYNSVSGGGSSSSSGDTSVSTSGDAAFSTPA